MKFKQVLVDSGSVLGGGTSDGSFYCFQNSTALIPAAVILTLYLLYLVECWHSKAQEIISPRNKVDIHTVYWKVEGMRRARPLVSWKALSFHFVNRAEQVSRMKDGKVYTCWKKVVERVNTNQVSCPFFADSCGWKDISRDLVELERHPITKVHFHKNFIFANAVAREEFQRQRELFVQDMAGLDDYVETLETLDLAGVTFPKSLTCWNRPDDLPWFARSHNFWILSALLLSWPMRIILELNTAHVHYQVTKLFGINSEFEIPRWSPAIDLSAFRGDQKCDSELPFQQSDRDLEKQPLLWEDSKSDEDLIKRGYLGDHARHFIPTGSLPPVKSILPRSVTLLMPQTCSSDLNFLLNFDSLENPRGGAVLFDDLAEIVPSYSEALLMCDSDNLDSFGAGEDFNVARTCADYNASHPKPSASMDQIALSGFRSDAAHFQHTSFLPKSTSLGRIRQTMFSTSGNRQGFKYPNDGVRMETKPPPDYAEALETSLPVFIPFLTRLRRRVIYLSEPNGDWTFLHRDPNLKWPFWIKSLRQKSSRLKSSMISCLKDRKLSNTQGKMGRKCGNKNGSKLYLKM
ncbi:unnamed protein product [Allacma fusca]|uniref:Uncharacterized protein n=1 Tax=Allacma fusca TaxID=39272 RepID=A0A8J2P2C8_9HEXA|nr:unnamed protein product [Allacma fusca]